MAMKRTSHDDDSTKNLQVPSTKRIRHDDDNKEQQHHLFRGGLTVNRWVNPSGRRRLQLCFMNNLPKRNYTQSRIKAEGGQPLRIELRDAENQHIVRDEGSLMKIQICVLHGHFRKEDWTAEEFDKQIVIPRVGKGQLLKGDDTVITLKDGVAFINNLEFTDIIKGRTNEVRLGAKIFRSNSIGLDIREGRSEPFRVLNVRGKAYQKHDRPSMNDELWRLRGIRKDGKLQEKLATHGIISVKDFVQLYKTNEASLREKIGNIAEKSWNKIIAHVKECDVYDEEEEERVKQHAYKNLNDLKQMPIDLVETSTGVQTAQYGGHDQTLQQFDDFPIDQQGLLNTDPTSFNQVALGEMFSRFDEVSQTGKFGRYLSMEQFHANLLSFDYGDGAGPCNHYSSPNFAEQHAYKNLNDLKQISIDTTIHGLVETSTGVQTAQHGGQDQTLQQFHFPIPQQGKKETGPGYVQPCASTSYANEGMNNCQINVDNSVPNITEIPQNNNVEDEICIEKVLNFINNVPFDFSDVVECSTSVNFINSGTDISNNGKPKAVWWCKIRAVIKWGISVKNVAAAKRH